MRVYLISGKARNGKDTIATDMKEYYESIGKKACVMHIANYIKHFAIDYFDWDGREETKPRSLLQKLGTEVIREKMNKPYFFTTRLLEDIEVLENFYDVFLIADVRLPLEINEVKKVYPDAVNLHIERPDLISELTAEQKTHITETALDGYDEYDYKIINRTLEDLKKDAIKIVKEVEVNEENDK